LPDYISENDKKELLAARFRQGARGPGHFDCWGICEEVARRAGIRMISFKEWVTKISERDRIFRSFADSDKFERLAGPEPFCIVGFTKAGNGKVRHMGIVLEDGRSFMHARRKLGVSITKLSDPQYAGRIYGYFKYVGA